MACKVLNPKSRMGRPHHDHAWIDAPGRQKCLRCGTLNPVGVPPWVRFWDHVEKTDTCWLWKGNTTHDGYGRFTLAEPGYKFDIYAHIYSYFLHRGKMPPPGQEFDHICEIRNCIFPLHLRFLPRADNVRRGLAKDECVRGHDLTLPDAWYHYRNGRRRCKLCIPIAMAEWKAKKQMIRPSERSPK